MWVEGGTEGVRNGEIRVREALALGANVIATACPFCLLTFEDAAKTAGLSEQIAVKDLTELVTESMASKEIITAEAQRSQSKSYFLIWW